MQSENKTVLPAPVSMPFPRQPDGFPLYFIDQLWNSLHLFTEYLKSAFTFVHLRILQMCLFKVTMHWECNYKLQQPSWSVLGQYWEINNTFK